MHKMFHNGVHTGFQSADNNKQLFYVIMKE